MADGARIARLADLAEFAELKHYFDEKREKEVVALGKKMFANPEAHDRLEAERLKARYAGIAEVLGLPVKARASLQRKEKE